MKTHTITTPNLVIERHSTHLYDITHADQGTTIHSLDTHDLADLILALTTIAHLGEAT